MRGRATIELVRGDITRERTEAIRGDVSFDIHCDEEIFAPLQMNESSWFLADLDVDHVAMPYGWLAGRFVPYGQYGDPDSPDGRLRTRSIQLARFLIAFMRRGEIDGVWQWFRAGRILTM